MFVPDYLDSPPSNQLSTCLRMPNVEGAPTDKTLMFCKILFSMLGRITLHFQLGKVPLYQPQVLRDFPAANNLTLLLFCCMKCKGNASISQRCPDLEGEGTRALWKKSQGDWKGKEEKDHMNLGLVSWKMYSPRRQIMCHFSTFITVRHSSVGSEVGIKTLSV